MRLKRSQKSPRCATLSLRPHYSGRLLADIVLVVSALFLSLYLAWQALSACNFFYPLLHDLIGIDRTIAEYGPKNRYRKSFEQTTPEQRAKLFRDIVHAINHGGEGLESIRYFDARGRELGLLLREPEIVHLRDVARLLTRLQWLAAGSGVLFAAALAFLRLRRLDIPSPGRILLYLLALLAVATLFITLSGAKELFYQWHRLVFPPGHQWFFYYEESLMTMLMKAPDLFAWLAALLVLFAAAFLYLILWLVQFWLRRHARP